MTIKQKLPQEAYYSIMGFLTPVMIECIDNLQGTNQYKKELKFHLNRALQECEKVSNEIYGRFSKIDKKEYQNLKEGEIPMLDIYNTISKAYDYAFDFFTTTPANDFPVLMDILNKAKQADLGSYQMQITGLQR
ncbi:hypothetical protein CAPN001_11600 [Capnocytophaga stomatis]|uniref:hypothetical protein n=1 Tax=Capnocytophaga stomatis TaxID=1848904 RepID=UPI001950304E|nr:hypothetical protein [Capnocytophaga stomatis]GIJ96591.1 hypothetical protein CAPN001_11600 [Capnocytophaga stomatis]